MYHVCMYTYKYVLYKEHIQGIRTRSTYQNHKCMYIHTYHAPSDGRRPMVEVVFA